MTKFENPRKARASESGNVLFLILIAVALFAALSYAVTQSTRSSGGDAGRETNRISSAQLTQYPASVRTSIVRMIIGGNDVDTLEFNAPSQFSTCTEDPPASNEYPRCVFHPTGGGATYVQAPGSLMASGGVGDWIYNGENEIENIGTTTAGAGSSAGTADLIAFLPGISLGVCESINEELGLPTGANMPTTTGILFTSVSNMVNTGSATSIGGGSGSIGANGANDSALVGQPFGCFQQPASTYVYYHVLVER